MVFELLPPDCPARHFHNFTICQRQLFSCRKSSGKAVPFPFLHGTSIHDTAVLFSADAGEKIIPDKGRIIKGLSVVPVLDVKIHQVRLFPFIKSKIVLSHDTDFRHRSAFIQPHPVQAVILVHFQRFFLFGRDII